MAESYFPFDSKFIGLSESGLPKGDRDGSAADFAKYDADRFTNGVNVFENPNALLVAAGSGMSVNIQEGVAYIQGRRYEVDAAGKTLTLPVGNSQPRIDRIVVTMDDHEALRSCVGTVKAGTPAASPTAPALIRNVDALGETFQISLMRILVPANATSISQCTLIDERADTSVCGWSLSRRTPQPPMPGDAVLHNDIGVPGGVAAFSHSHNAYDALVAAELIKPSVQPAANQFQAADTTVTTYTDTEIRRTVRFNCALPSAAPTLRFNDTGLAYLPIYAIGTTPYYLGWGVHVLDLVKEAAGSCWYVVGAYAEPRIKALEDSSAIKPATFTSGSNFTVDDAGTAAYAEGKQYLFYFTSASNAPQVRINALSYMPLWAAANVPMKVKAGQFVKVFTSVSGGAFFAVSGGGGVEYPASTIEQTIKAGCALLENEVVYRYGSIGALTKQSNPTMTAMKGKAYNFGGVPFFAQVENGTLYVNRFNGSTWDYYSTAIGVNAGTQYCVNIFEYGGVLVFGCSSWGSAMQVTSFIRWTGSGLASYSATIPNHTASYNVPCIYIGIIAGKVTKVDASSGISIVPVSVLLAGVWTGMGNTSPSYSNCNAWFACELGGLLYIMGVYGGSSSQYFVSFTFNGTTISAGVTGLSIGMTGGFQFFDAYKFGNKIYIAGGYSSQMVLSWTFEGSVLNYLGATPTVTTGYVYTAAFRALGATLYLAFSSISSSTSPYVFMLYWSGSAWVKIANPAVMPTSSIGGQFTVMCDYGNGIILCYYGSLSQWLYFYDTEFLIANAANAPVRALIDTYCGITKQAIAQGASGLVQRIRDSY